MDKAIDVNLTAIEISVLQGLLNDAILADMTRDNLKAIWRKLHRALGDLAMEEIREAHAALFPDKCIYCDQPAVTPDEKGAQSDVGDRPGPKCQRHSRPN